MSIVMLNQFGDPLQCHTLAFSDSSRSFRWFVWRRTIERPVLLHTLRWHPTLAPYAGTLRWHIQHTSSQAYRHSFGGQKRIRDAAKKRF